MNRFQVKKHYVEEIAEIINFLEDQLEPLLPAIGKPRLVSQPGHEHFLFDSPMPARLQF